MKRHARALIEIRGVTKSYRRGGETIEVLHGIVLINAKYFDETRQFGKGRVGWYIIRVAARLPVTIALRAA